MTFAVTVKGWNQHEMLMTIAIPQAIASWRMKTARARLSRRFAFIRLIQTVENIHQGGLACAILPTTAWISPRLDIKRNLIIAVTPGNRFVILLTCKSIFPQECQILI